MTLNKIENAFFELLRIALGTQEKMTVALNDAEWKDVAQMAVKQSVLGILFTAVETLPEEQRPYNDLYIDMYKWVDTIEQRNEHMNKLTASVSNRFRKDGFPNCILKGQGVALLYPKPLRRHSGDVDVWLKGKRKDMTSLNMSEISQVLIDLVMFIWASNSTKKMSLKFISLHPTCLILSRIQTCSVGLNHSRMRKLTIIHLSLTQNTKYRLLPPRSM